MSTLAIPLEKNPYYFFLTVLDNNICKIQMRWNTADSAWYMDLENVSKNYAIKGIKFVTGVNLLEPYALYDLGRMYIIDLEDEDLDPDFDNIGTRYKLAYVEK